MENKYIVLSGFVLFVFLSLLSYFTINKDTDDSDNKLTNRIFISLLVSLVFTGGFYYYKTYIQSENLIFCEDPF